MTRKDILIRALEPEDYAAFHDIHAQPRVIWGTAQMPFPSMDSWRKRLLNPPANHHGLVAEFDGRVVGSIGLTVETHSPRRTHAGSIGMAVHDDFHGTGIGKAMMAEILDIADNWLALRRVDLRVYTDNQPAIALYQQFGFEVEGTIRRHSYRDGCYIDAHMMGRLNDPGS